MRFINSLIVTAFVLIGFAAAPQAKAADVELYLVTFTAEWCPNCKILDPRLAAALDQFTDGSVEEVTLDMTDGPARLDSFEKIDGTILAGVYGDHLGLTGISILTAADSGEKIGCLTRDFTTKEIIDLIHQAQQIVNEQPALSRTGDLGDCPRANGRAPI
ncbi:MAG: thioredoxin domain-containing protein [bacterium]